MVTLRDVRDALKNVKGGDTSFTAQCPAHEDQRNSLSVTAGREGRILLNCHAGCQPNAIAQRLGWSLADLGPGRTDRIRYDYHDERGNLLFQVERSEPKDFRCRVPDGRGGWNYRMNGTRRVPYRLPQVVQAVQARKTVVVVEGEKDVETLERSGFTATTNPHGAGKWRPEYSDCLTGADVVILPDNDPPGLEHARQVSESLRGKARRVRILMLPGLPAKADVTDWLGAGHTVEELRALIANAPEIAPTPSAEEPKPTHRAVSLAELLTNPELLQPPTSSIPRLGWRGYSTILAGREKRAGKSTLLKAAAAAKSRGAAFLGERCTPGNVLMAWFEEHPADLVQSMRDFGADPAKVYYLDRLQSTTSTGKAAELLEEARKIGAELILVDSFQRFVEGVVTDARSSAEMHPPAQALTDVARQSNAAVVFTHHAKKDGDDYRDSTALGAAVDVIALVTVPDEKADETRRAVTVRGRVRGLSDFEYRFSGDSIDLVRQGETPVELRILDAITASPGISMRALRSLIGGRAKTVDGATEQLLAEGRIEDRGDGKGRAFHISEARKSLRDKSGHASTLGISDQNTNVTEAPKSLWDKVGHGRDTQRDTPNGSGCVPSLIKGDGDTLTPEQLPDGVVHHHDGSQSLTPERIAAMRAARAARSTGVA